MNVLKAIALAEIRHAELIEQADRHRLAQRAADFHREGTSQGRGLREELMALCARMSAMRRPDLAKSPDLTPAAAETT